jgi:hypothetical protein
VQPRETVKVNESQSDQNTFYYMHPSTPEAGVAAKFKNLKIAKAKFAKLKNCKTSKVENWKIVKKAKMFFRLSATAMRRLALLL